MCVKTQQNYFVPFQGDIYQREGLRTDGGASVAVHFGLESAFLLEPNSENFTRNLVNCPGVGGPRAPAVVSVIHPWPGPATGVFSPPSSAPNCTQVPGQLQEAKPETRDRKARRQRPAAKNYTPNGRTTKL